MVVGLSLERPEWEYKGKNNTSPATWPVPNFPEWLSKWGEMKAVEMGPSLQNFSKGHESKAE